MSHQNLADAFAPAEERNRQRVIEETWGHLAPKKNKSYAGRIVFAIGCYDSGSLNPTPLVCDLKGLDDSPFFCAAIVEWLQELPEEHRQPGCVYAWRGAFRNYEFSGTITRLLDANF